MALHISSSTHALPGTLVHHAPSPDARQASGQRVAFVLITVREKCDYRGWLTVISIALVIGPGGGCVD